MKFFRRVFMFFARRNFFDWMPDELYVRLCYKCHMGKKLNLKNPQTFNEKLQWLKLYDRKPEYTRLVDKYAVREHIKEKIGEEYLIPLIGVWDRVEDIDFDKLPNQFVLKCTHDSGGLVICNDKSTLDIEEAKKTLQHFYKREYYYIQREWPYKNVPHRIIAEKYMVDESGTQLKDYKFFCFDGEPKAVQIVTDRTVSKRSDFFDINFNRLPFARGSNNSGKEIKKPQGYDEMVRLAKVLSQGFAHIRVDFYDVNGKVYFGELTFFSNSGFSKFHPDKYDKIFGDWIKLPTDK
ncbi:MAG: glycosyl transferase [Eubacterium sp.]|nr:glycosyl transferase [Eubacterium sp.]